MPSSKQDLRDLARQIELAAHDHPCYGQVATIVRNCVDHILAVAVANDINKKLVEK